MLKLFQRDVGLNNCHFGGTVYGGVELYLVYPDSYGVNGKWRNIGNNTRRQIKSLTEFFNYSRIHNVDSISQTL